MFVLGNKPLEGNISSTTIGHNRYLVVLDSASWFEARVLCGLYGKGFYLANINGLMEINDIRQWLTSVPAPEPYCKRTRTILVAFLNRNKVVDPFLEFANFMYYTND